MAGGAGSVCAVAGINGEDPGSVLTGAADGSAAGVTSGEADCADGEAAGFCSSSCGRLAAGLREKYGEKTAAIQFLLKKIPIADISSARLQIKTGFGLSEELV